MGIIITIIVTFLVTVALLRREFNDRLGRFTYLGNRKLQLIGEDSIGDRHRVLSIDFLNNEVYTLPFDELEGEEQQVWDFQNIELLWSIKNG